MTVLRIAAAVTLWLVCAAPARAQAPPALPKADLFVSLGWLNAHKPDIDTYNDWYNRSLYTAATAGWYWTEHLKTELEGAVSTDAEIHANRELTIDGQRAFASSQYTFSTRRLTVNQQYQFGHNAWFHPHLTAGLDMTWERIRQTDEEIYVFDPAQGQTRIIRRPPADPDRVEFHARPFAGAGFKAYVSPRAFFRADLRLAGLGDVDEVLFRAGFGIDF